MHILLCFECSGIFKALTHIESHGEDEVWRGKLRVRVVGGGKDAPSNLPGVCLYKSFDRKYKSFDRPLSLSLPVMSKSDPVEPWAVPALCSSSMHTETGSSNVALPFVNCNVGGNLKVTVNMVKEGEMRNSSGCVCGLCTPQSAELTTEEACIYGDLMKIDTSGASLAVVKSSNLTVPGVEASHMLAEEDLISVKKYKEIIFRVACDGHIDPAVICGIISRISRGGKELKNGLGDNGHCFGLMQISMQYHQPMGEWNSEEHIRQGTEILIHFINRIRNKFPTWPLQQQLKGGIGAYYTGDGNVNSYEDLESNTQAADFANDVVARAQWFKTHLF